MLEIRSSHGPRDCSGTSRRDFLRAGALGVGGWTLSQLLRSQAIAAEGGSAYRGKSVVLLFLCGGASHIETFDPKMSAPAEFRSSTGAIPTAVPGLEFGGTFEGLAARADKLAVVRSYAPHDIADHAQAIKHVLTSGDVSGTSIGSRFARYRAACDDEAGILSYSTLIEENEPDDQYQEDRDRMLVGSRTGSLGSRFAAFAAGSRGELMENMQLRLPESRLADRRALLRDLDRTRRQNDASGVMADFDEFEQQAYDVLLGGGAMDALDLAQEPQHVVEAYDTSMFEVGWKANRPSTLGERLLLARRLCQAGCGFVTVGSAGWDNHANDNHPNVPRGMELLGRPLDKAVCAFLDDLDRLGLSDEILLIITSEFGRTPRLQDNGGRDHWPGLAPLVFAGGGLPCGQVIGESTNKAEEPRSEPIGYPELLGTIWHTLFDVGQLRLAPSLPTPMLRELEQVRPIRELT